MCAPVCSVHCAVKALSGLSGKAVPLLASAGQPKRHTVTEFICCLFGKKNKTLCQLVCDQTAMPCWNPQTLQSRYAVWWTPQRKSDNPFCFIIRGLKSSRFSQKEQQMEKQLIT